MLNFFLKKTSFSLLGWQKQRLERKATLLLTMAQAFEIRQRAKANAFKSQQEAANAAKIVDAHSRALREQTRQSRATAKSADWARRRQLLADSAQNFFRSLGRGILWPFKKLFWNWPRKGWQYYRGFKENDGRSAGTGEDKQTEKKPFAVDWPRLFPSILFFLITLITANFEAGIRIWPHSLLFTFCAIYFWWLRRKRESGIIVCKALVYPIIFVWVMAWLGYYLR